MTDYQFYMLLATAAGPLVALGVGGAQCLLIFSGLRQMRAASRVREQLHEEIMAAHTETMAAHTKTMAALEKQHAENMTVLKELIRRTGSRIE